MRALVRFLTFLGVALVITVVWLFDKKPESPKVAPPPPPPVRQESAALPPIHEPGRIASWPSLEGKEVELAPNQLQKNYYVILDCSGSMSEQQCYGTGTKMEVAQNALARFAGLVPGNANLGLSIFINNEIKELVSLGQDNRDKFVATVRATYPSGQTPLHSAIKSGYAKLTAQARRQLGYGDYTLVVVTDGLASPGEDPTDIVGTILAQSPVEIQTIGFCIDENHPLNIPGRTVFKAANSEEELQRGLADVLAESASFDVSDFQGIR